MKYAQTKTTVDILNKIENIENEVKEFKSIGAHLCLSSRSQESALIRVYQRPFYLDPRLCGNDK